MVSYSDIVSTMKNLKITDDQHERIKAGAESSNLPIRSFTEALVNYGLDKFECGAVQLQTVRLTEPQIEEVGA